VAGSDEIRFWIMTWGSKGEVIGPGSLRERLPAEAQRMAKRYDGAILKKKTLSYCGIEEHLR
jgi:hypothetical protein